MIKGRGVATGKLFLALMILAKLNCFIKSTISFLSVNRLNSGMYTNGNLISLIIDYFRFFLSRVYRQGDKKVLMIPRESGHKYLFTFQRLSFLGLRLNRSQIGNFNGFATVDTVSGCNTCQNSQGAIPKAGSLPVRIGLIG